MQLLLACDESTAVTSFGRPGSVSLIRRLYHLAGYGISGDRRWGEWLFGGVWRTSDAAVTTAIVYLIFTVFKFIFIMRPSSLGGGRILRCTLSVRLSVCLSVRPVIERHVAPPSELQ